MDPELKLRLDLGLLLLAALVGTTSVAAYGVTDIATVAAGIVAAILVTVAILFFGGTMVGLRSGTES